MKKQTYTIAFAVITMVASFASCKKGDDTNTTTPPSTSTSSTPTPSVGPDVDGALTSLKVDVTTSVAGVPYTVTTENGVAAFFASKGNYGTFTDAGAVSVNSVMLDKGSNNGYTKSATTGQSPADLNFDSGNSIWSVAGAGAVPAISYKHSIPFPAFTGTLPSSVSRSAALTVSFSGKVSDADSVIIFITKDNHSVTRTFAASAASGTISATDLSSLPAVSDNTALMEVISYRYTVQTFGAKSYAFVKERAVVANINIR